MNLLELINLKTLKEWQELVGAMLGTLIPILFSLLILGWQSNKAFIQELEQLNRLLSRLIAELYSTRKELELLVQRLEGLLKELHTEQSEKFFLGNTNFPTVEIAHESKLPEAKPKSIYLTRRLLFCHNLLKDLNSACRDLQHEFRRALSENHERTINASQMDLRPRDQKVLLCAEVEAIKGAVDTTLKDNVPIIATVLVGTNEYLKIYRIAPTIVRLWFEGLFKSWVNSAETDQLMKSRTDLALSRLEQAYKEQWSGYSSVRYSKDIQILPSQVKELSPDP